MRNKRAKMLRLLAGYDMKLERRVGRKYFRYDSSREVVCDPEGSRKQYHAWKRQVKQRFVPPS